jgi:hypothetical protein
VATSSPASRSWRTCTEAVGWAMPTRSAISPTVAGRRSSSVRMRERLVRSARPPRVLVRVRAVRMMARGLRVERELEFKPARVTNR